MDDKTLLEYWLVLYRRRGLILFVTVAAAAAAWGISAMLTPVYEAKATCFAPATPDVVSYLSPSPDASPKSSPLLPMASEEAHAPYIGFLKSRAMAERVHRSMPSKDVEEIARDVDFSISNEYLLEIYARDQKPERAAALADAYVSALDEMLADYARDRIRRNQELVQEEIGKVRAKLARARQALEEFQQRSKAVALDEERSQLAAQKADLQRQADAARVALQENRSRIAALKEQLRNEASLLSEAEFVISSPLMERLRQELTEVEIKLAALKTEFKEKHPDVQALKNQHDEIKAKMNREMNRIVTSQIKAPGSFYENIRQKLVYLLVEQQGIQASLGAYDKVIRDLEEKLSALPGLMTRSDALRIDIAKYQGMLKTLELDLEEARLQQKREPAMVVRVEKASVPEEPSFPRTMWNVLVAALAGLVAGAAYAFLVEYLEETRDERVFRLVQAIEASEQEAAAGE